MDKPSQLMAVVSLMTTDECRKFMRAAEEIESSLECTSVTIVNTADYVVGRPPPKKSDEAGGDWEMYGVISGPTTDQINGYSAASRQNILITWAGEITMILESHGLIEEKLKCH